MGKKQIVITEEGLVPLEDGGVQVVGPCIYCGTTGNKVQVVGAMVVNGRAGEAWAVMCGTCRHVSPPDQDPRIAIAKHNEPERRLRFYRKPRRDVELLMAKEMLGGLVPANLERVKEDA